MSGEIDHYINAVRAAVPSLDAMEKPNLSDADYQRAFDLHRHVAEWAWEHLNDADRDEFFAALAEDRVVDAHAVLTRGVCWPWRQRQWDQWLQNCTAGLTSA